jgi:hypothetical protein
MSVVARCAAVSIAFVSTAVLAQTPLPKPDLDLLVNGTVNAIARQSDGSVVIGGVFNAVAGVRRSNLARLLPDGTLDPDWNPTADDQVRALAVDSSDNVYVGGYFHNVSGQPRGFLAKVAGSGSGALDANWNPSPTNVVTALAMDSSDALFVDGYYSSIYGTNGGLVKLSTSGAGSIDATWRPSVGGSYALAIGGTDIYAGGSFGVAKVSTSGSGASDPAWNPNVTDSNGVLIEMLSLDGNGSLYIGGYFDHIGGTPRARLAKLSAATGALDASWTPSGNFPFSILAANGFVYLDAYFGIGPATLRRVSAVDGSLDATWDPHTRGVVSTLAPDGAGGVYAGGDLIEAAGAQHLAFAHIDSSGNAASSADIEGTPVVKALARQHDGSVILGGHFVGANGLPCKYLLRLLPDWTLDRNWVSAADSDVVGIAVDSSDAVYAVGPFAEIDGVTRYGAAKLDRSGAVDGTWDPAGQGVLFLGFPQNVIAVDPSDNIFIGTPNGVLKLSSSGIGAPDPNWNPGLSGQVYALLPDGNGQLYVGGGLQLGGQSYGLARLSTGDPGTWDSSWTPQVPFVTTALALDKTGGLYAGGAVLNFFGSLPPSLYKYSTSGTGATDPLWNPSPNTSSTAIQFRINSLATDNAGSVYVAGQFETIGGQSRKGLAKLSATGDGAADPAWDVAPDGAVNVLAYGPSGALYVGGGFSTIGAQPRESIARFVVVDQIFADGFENP